MIKFTALLLIVHTCLCFRVSLPRAGCNINISQLDPEPVVVTALTNEFLYPEPSATTVSIDTDETILISCPGGQLSIDGAQAGTTVEAQCVSSTNFIIKGQTIDFDRISCSKKAFHTARYTGNSCESGGKEIEIGFVLTPDVFARQIIICFDESNLTSFYSTYNLTRSIEHHEANVSRPYFIEDDFYNLNVPVNNLYVRGGQRATINGLLGLPASSTKYIQDGSDFYLARGHLTAKADFVYASQQTATFHYVNAAPQWQTFNGGNWETAESNVRNYAEANGLDLRVYTGTYGVTVLPHEDTGEDIPLYLYVGDGVLGIPVPELYWKVVYDPSTQRGVALVGHNNPYRGNIAVICDDISESIAWLTWDAHDVKNGLSYACTVDDLRSKVPYLPYFEVNGILL